MKIKFNFIMKLSETIPFFITDFYDLFKIFLKFINKQIPFIKTQNSKLKTQNSKLKTQNSKLKTQNSKLKTQNNN